MGSLLYLKFHATGSPGALSHRGREGFQQAGTPYAEARGCKLRVVEKGVENENKRYSSVERGDPAASNVCGPGLDADIQRPG